MPDGRPFHRARRFAGVYLLIALVLGGIALFMGPGFYSGRVDGQHVIVSELSGGVLFLDAESGPQWYWVRPRNLRYLRATLKVRDKSVPVVHVDLAGGTWSVADRHGALDADGLARAVAPLLEMDPADAELSRTMDWLNKSLEEMRDGNFRRPQHHPYSIETPIHGSYLHISWGSNWAQNALLLWLLVWPLALLRIQAPPYSNWLTPRSGFFVGTGVVLALNLILLAIGNLTSPGSVAELIEMANGLLNAPAYMVLGDSRGWSPFNIPAGAVLWGIILSIGSLWLSPARRRRDPSINPPPNPPSQAN